MKRIKDKIWTILCPLILFLNFPATVLADNPPETACFKPGFWGSVGNFFSGVFTGDFNAFSTCYVKPAKKTLLDNKAEFKAVTCSNNFAGINVQNGKWTFAPPCDNTKQTFEDVMDSAANVFARVRQDIWWICIILAVISMVFGAIQLAAAKGNPQGTQKAWGRIKISLIVIALIGGISTIVTMAFGMFK